MFSQGRSHAINLLVPHLFILFLSSSAGGCKQEEKSSAKGISKAESPLEKPHGQTVAQFLSDPKVHKALDDLFAQSGVKTKMGLPGFQVHWTALLLHDWLKSGLASKVGNKLQYSRADYVFLDENLGTNGEFLFERFEKAAKTNVKDVSEWVYVVDPGTHRIKVAGRVPGHTKGFPKAMWYPVHSMVAASDLNINALDSRALGAGILEFDPQTHRIAQVNNSSGHFRPDFAPIMPYIVTLFSIHGYPNAKFKIYTPGENGKLEKKFYCGTQQKLDASQYQGVELPPEATQILQQANVQSIPCEN